MKNVARERKALLRHLRLDVRLVAATQPAGQPGTAGSVNELQDAINRLLAATQPATQPSTGTPGTQPSRSPTTGPAATQPR